jgi:putative nucleotidyltransferase with HDIG domain
MTERNNLFEEMQAHLLNDDAPSAYFKRICGAEFFTEYPLSLLCRLKEVPQSPKHHPEGSVWNHTMLVVDQAAGEKGRSRDPRAFMWAALLHDLGKAETTSSEKGRITAYNHDKVGALRAKDFLEELTGDMALVRRVVSLVRWHMQILFVVRSMRFADIKNMLKEIEMDEIALLGYCDRMGRLNADRKAETENLKKFREKCLEFIAKND